MEKFKLLTVTTPGKVVSNPGFTSIFGSDRQRLFRIEGFQPDLSEMASRCVSSRPIGNLILLLELTLRHISPYADRSSKFAFLKELPSGLPRLTRTMLCTNKEQTKTIHLQPLEAMVPDSTDPPRGYRYDPEPWLLIAIALLLLH